MEGVRRREYPDFKSRLERKVTDQNSVQGSNLEIDHLTKVNRHDRDVSSVKRLHYERLSGIRGRAIECPV